MLQPRGAQPRLPYTGGWRRSCSGPTGFRDPAAMLWPCPVPTSASSVAWAPCHPPWLTASPAKQPLINICHREILTDKWARRLFRVTAEGGLGQGWTLQEVSIGSRNPAPLVAFPLHWTQGDLAKRETGVRLRDSPTVWGFGKTSEQSRNTGPQDATSKAGSFTLSQHFQGKDSLCPRAHRARCPIRPLKGWFPGCTWKGCFPSLLPCTKDGYGKHLRKKKTYHSFPHHFDLVLDFCWFFINLISRQKLPSPIFMTCFVPGLVLTLQGTMRLWGSWCVQGRGRGAELCGGCNPPLIAV